MKSILALVAQIDLGTVAFPIDAVNLEKETVVGTLTDDLRRFWGFLSVARETKLPEITALEKEHTEYQALHEEMHGRGKKARNPEHPDHQKVHDQIHEVRNKLKEVTAELSSLKNIFWQLVRLEFDLINGGSIGIRSGGEVVTVKEMKEDDESLTAHLESLFGRPPGGQMQVFVVG